MLKLQESNKTAIYGEKMLTIIKTIATGLVISASLSGCSSESSISNPSQNEGVELQAKPPRFSISGGKYDGNQQVTIFRDSLNDTVIYTINDGRSMVYSDIPIQIIKFTKLQAVSVRNGMSSLGISATYSIWNPAITYDSLSYNSKMYRFVKIGDKYWMAENLDYEGEFGSEIGRCYGNQLDSCSKYGRLYTWNEAIGKNEINPLQDSIIQGICPIGWHIPLKSEFESLSILGQGNYYWSSQYKAMREWGNETYTTDKFGFRVLAAGFANRSGLPGYGFQFSSVGNMASFWTSKETDTANAVSVAFGGVSNQLISFPSILKQNFALPIRCVKD